MTTQLAARTFHPLVLLVEDDVDTREMYHMALEFDGCLARTRTSSTRSM
jgi:hypothetical protein